MVDFDNDGSHVIYSSQLMIAIGQHLVKNVGEYFLTASIIEINSYSVYHFLVVILVPVPETIASQQNKLIFFISVNDLNLRYAN